MGWGFGSGLAVRSGDTSYGSILLTRTRQSYDSGRVFTLRPVLLRSVLLTQPRYTPLRILPYPNPPLLRHFLSPRRGRSTVQRSLVFGTGGPCLGRSGNECRVFLPFRGKGLLHPIHKDLTVNEEMFLRVHFAHFAVHEFIVACGSRRNKSRSQTRDACDQCAAGASRSS
jgi:hypothetical protein